MVKRLLSASAAAALVFAACTTEDPVSVPPAPNYPTNSSSSVQEFQGFLSSSSDFYSSSSAIFKNDTNFMPEDAANFTKNDCYVVSNAAENKVELYMTYAGEALNKTSMTLLPGNLVEMESTVLYDSKISDAKVKQYCEESKEDALVEGATVICDKRSVTAKQTKPTNGETFEEVAEKAQEMCNLMKMMFPDMESSSSAQILLPQSSSSAYIPPKTENGKATCEVLQDTDEAFKMVIVAPDSVTMTFEATYQKKIFTLLGVAEFAPNIPQSVIDQECVKSKAEAAEDDDGTIVTCNGNVITEKLSGAVPDNMVPLVAPTLIAQCDIIQETGVIPEDDDDF
jgi:hypothetical protein